MSDYKPNGPEISSGAVAAALCVFAAIVLSLLFTAKHYYIPLLLDELPAVEAESDASAADDASLQQ